MGAACCKSTVEVAAEKKDAEIESKNAADAEVDAHRVKLLLLGAGESGKSTILKQFRVLYGVGFSEEDRKALLPVVHGNTLHGIRALLGFAAESSWEVTPKEAVALVMDASGKEGTALEPAVGRAIAQVWAHEAVKRAYEQRSRFQLLDNAAYFLDKVAESSAPGYVPSIEDVVRTRVRTSGILEESYFIDTVQYTIYDVGGQRNERRKWIHCFEDVTAIIFVAAVSEYDQTLYEENTQNRLVEAIDLFGKVCSSRYFESTSIILFLNKRDLFESKIRSIDLRCPNPDPFRAEKEPTLFADYDGGCDYEKALKYILARFMSMNKNPRKEVFYRVTCATDPDNVKTVFTAAREIILKQNLASSGLLEH